MTKESQPAETKHVEIDAKPTENLYVFPNFNGKGVQIKVTAKDREEAIKKAEKSFKEGTK